MTVYKWSTSPNSNDTADGSINLREGMAPSQLNDSSRAMMAAIAKWRNDMSGRLVTTGTGTAYVLTTNQGLNALTDGISVAARINVTSGTAPTLNVDSLGAKAIASVYGTAVPSGKLLANAVYTFVYNQADDKWIMHGLLPDEFASGTTIIFRQTTAPTGWTKDTSHNNKALRVVSGTVSSGGTTAFTSVFTTRTLARSDLPNVTITTSTNGDHTHPLSFTSSGADNPAGGNNAFCTDGSAKSGPYTPNYFSMSATGDHDHTFNLNGGVAQTSLDFNVQYVDVIIALKN